MQRKRKAAVYVTSDRGLLVFSHACHPEVGLQVPSGTIGENEEPLAAAVRELEEETGILATPEKFEPLPFYTHDMRPFRAEVQERYPFHLRVDAAVSDSWTHWEKHPDLIGAKPERFDFHWEPINSALPHQLAVGQGRPLVDLCDSRYAPARERLECHAPNAAVREWAVARRQAIAQAIAKLFPSLSIAFPSDTTNDRVLGALLEHVVSLAREAASLGREPVDAERLCARAADRLGNTTRRILVIEGEDCLEVGAGTYETPLLVCTSDALDLGLKVVRPDYADAITFLERTGFSVWLDQGLAVVVELSRKTILEATNSYTLSGLPGTIFCDWVPSQLRLAETLLHEALHNWLNMAFAVLQPRGFGDQLYWSPWRHKMRPAQGLIQATFVFSILCQFFCRCLKMSGIDPVDKAYAAARLRAEEAVLKRQVDALSEPLGQVTNVALKSLLSEELNRAINLRPDHKDIHYDA
ncbi:MAG: NUDIX domain-containing protein [Nitrospiraceae bacterium]|nr:NUDIX domain-containing protein [Nitrospiraceae bacterium]